MKRFQLILLNTIHKEIRSKTLIFVSVMTVVTILLMNSLISFISAEFLSQVGNDWAASGSTIALVVIINKFTTLLSIIFGVNVLKSDKESNVAPLLLAFPISRLEYLGARIVGTWLIVMSYYLGSVFLAQLLLSSSVGSFVGGPHLLGAMVFSSLSNFVIIVISAFLGLSFPKVMAFLMTTIGTTLVTASNSYFKLKEVSTAFDELSLLKLGGAFLHYLFPRVGNIDEIAITILTQSETKLNISIELAHYFVSLGLFLFIFYFFFKKREV